MGKSRIAKAAKENELLKEIISKGFPKEGGEDRLKNLMKSNPSNITLAKFVKKEYGKGGIFVGENQYQYDWKGIHPITNEDSQEKERFTYILEQ